MTDPSRFRYAVEAAYLGVAFHIARLRIIYGALVLALALIGASGWYVFFVPAAAFPADRIITIPAGSTLPEIAEQLAAAGVIRSPNTFMLLGRLRGGAGHMQSGKYIFEQPVGVLRIEERVQDGAYGIVATRITFYEGTTVREMAVALKKAFPDFDDAGFLAEALPLEGHLFPDTYFFYPDALPHDVVVKMYGNFLDQTATIQPAIDAFGKTLSDDLVMASLLEKEGKTLADKRMIAGILWNRIRLGMPLQVDAVFGYINERATYSPKASDLVIDSPYNTYLHKGLPPGPIDNPGLDSILAAVTPATTTDLYYLTGTDGKMYYAKTFAEHKLNRAKYLD